MPSGLNVSRGINEGAAQVWDFSPVMRFAYNLHQQEEGKKRLAQKQYEDLMTTYDPKRAKLRSADVPEYVEKYKLFADTKRALASGKVKDPIQIAELNNIADKTAGEMQQLVAISAEATEGLKTGLQGYMNNSDNFDPNYPFIAGAANQTPSRLLKEGQLIGVDPKANPYGGRDLTNPTTFYQKAFDVKELKDYLPTVKRSSMEGRTEGGKKYNREVEVQDLEETLNTTVDRFEKLSSSKPSALKFFSNELLRDQQDGTFEEVMAWAKDNAAGVKVSTPAGYVALRERMNFQPVTTKQGEWQFTDNQKLENQRDNMQFGANLSFGNAVALHGIKNPPDNFDYKAYEDAANAVTGNVTTKEGQTVNAHEYLVQQTNNIVRNLKPGTEGLVITRQNLFTKPANEIIRKLFPENAEQVMKEMNAAQKTSNNDAVQVFVKYINDKYKNDIGKTLTINDLNLTGIPVVITKETKKNSKGQTEVITMPNFIYGTNLKGKVAQLLNQGKKGTQDVLDNYEFGKPTIDGWDD